MWDHPEHRRQILRAIRPATYTDAYGNCKFDGDRDGYSHADPHGNCNVNSNTSCYGDSDSYAHFYANAKTYSGTEISSYTGASPIASSTLE
jgi:hypothetical protein